MSFLLSILMSISGLSAFAFNASADNINTRYTINKDAWLDYYDTIDGTYCNVSGEYMPCTFTFTGWTTGVQQGYQPVYYPNNVSYSMSDYTYAVYVSDFKQSNVFDDFQIPKVILYPNIHFSSCEYVSTGLAGYMYPDSSASSFFNRSYNSVNSYNYMTFDIPSISYSENISLGYNQSLQNPASITYRHSALYGFSAYQSETDIVLSEMTFSFIHNATNDPCYIAIALPIVSEHTVLESPYIPPEPPITTAPVVTGNGSGSGSIVTNDSGVTQFNFNITNEFQVPPYLQSGSFSEYSDNFPQTVSGLVSDMETYGTAAASDIAEMEDYDLSGFWDFFGRMIPLRVVAAILAVSWISLLGWILTKYRG